MKHRTEHDLQIAIVTLAKLMAIDRALPERRTKLLKLYYIPNGVKPQGKDKREAARIGAIERAMGVRRGMPDLHLPVRGVWYDGNVTTYKTDDISLYMELKLPGKQVPEYQRLIHDELREEGNRVDVVRDTLEAERIFREHLAL